jgi:hypothetical protein
MHNTPIGPTGAAMEKPIIKPLRKKLMSMFHNFLGFWISPLTPLAPLLRGEDKEKLLLAKVSG